MKKTVELKHEKIKYPRLVEAAKHDIKKYVKRENNKKLPSGFDIWEFDCAFGADQQSAEPVELHLINKKIDQVENEGLTSFYVEVIARAANKPVREPFYEEDANDMDAEAPNDGDFDNVDEEELDE